MDIDFPQKKQMFHWVNRWKKVGPFLENLRQEEASREDVQKTIVLLDDAFRSALLHNPPEAASGLVEQQRLFMKVRR